MNASQVRMRISRRGFTIIEVIMAIVVAGLLAAIGIPAMAGTLRTARVNGAATTLVSDFELAMSTSARLRRPIVVLYDASNKRFTHYDGSDIVFRRGFGSGTDYNLESLSVTSSYTSGGNSGVVFWPNGLANTQITATLSQGGYSRKVIVTRAGQFRISR